MKSGKKYEYECFRKDQIFLDILQYLRITLLAENQAVIQKEKGWRESE